MADAGSAVSADRKVAAATEKKAAAVEEKKTGLNPMAREFVPPSRRGARPLSANAPEFFMRRSVVAQHHLETEGVDHWNSTLSYIDRVQRPQRENYVKKTVYVSEIDSTVSEQSLAELFLTCGEIVDCRICGDPSSPLRFAFIEFADEDDAIAALSLDGAYIGLCPVRVSPSKTAILPVNPIFLPQSEYEREQCSRTVYCTNVANNVTQIALRGFFERFCGPVSRLRILGEQSHSSRIAFVEFVQASSAIAALSCSGIVVGALPIRVSPSKTPIKPRPILPFPSSSSSQ